MKSITTSGSFRKADSSLDATLNPVELPSKEIVSWGIAFPRPASDALAARADSRPSTTSSLSNELDLEPR